jgi:outer membrane protein assembly factor BamD
MRAPQRDQTETREAVKELQVFVERYANSSLIEEGRAKLRAARDRLSESSYEVAYFYYKQRWYPGAISRFKELIKDDPGFTRRDAVYFFYAESLLKSKTGMEAEALPLYERLVNEFEKSEYLAEAQRRIEELKQAQSKAGQ